MDEQQVRFGARGTWREVTHDFPIADFDAIASAGGDVRTIERLIDSEYSRRLVLLYELCQILKNRAEILGPLPPVSEAWRLLQRIEERSPADLASVLLHPQVGVWFSHTLRRLADATTDAVPVWAAAGHLYCVILSAAVLSGVDITLPVPTRRGVVVLPALGVARLGSDGDYGVAIAEVRNGIVNLRSGNRSVSVDRLDTPAPHWWNLRRLRVRDEDGRSLELMLDDIDPYRDLANPIEPRRLDEMSVSSWRGRLAGAWTMISRADSALADAMRAGFWSITPLPEDPGWDVRSASTGDAFGAALMSLPRDPATLAVTMVHEFQHNKLGALLHLVDLTVPVDPQPQLYAPWRPDPRPAGGLLQGVYAFLGITAFWRQRRSEGSAAHQRTAHFEFAFARRQTWAGLQSLRRSGQLSAWGLRFVNGMASRLRPWIHESVPASANRAAWALLSDHRAGWRIRNLEVDPLWVQDMVTAWTEERRPRAVTRARVLVRSDSPLWLHQRLQLYRSMSIGGHEAGPATRRPTTEGDALLLQGLAPEATERHYLAAIEAAPDDFDAWTGLGLAVAQQPGRGEWRPLLHRPELVKALFDALPAESRPSPIETALWLAR